MKSNILFASIATLIGMCCPLSAARLSNNTIHVSYEISSAGLVARLEIHGRLTLQDNSLDLGVPAFPGISKLVGLDHDVYTVSIEKSNIKIDNISIGRVNIEIPERRLRFASRSLPGVVLSLSPAAKNDEYLNATIKISDDSVTARNLGILYFEPCPIGASISVDLKAELEAGSEIVSNIDLINGRDYKPKTNCATTDPQFLFYRLGSLSSGSN